jgi:hypothetical protein
MRQGVASSKLLNSMPLSSNTNLTAAVTQGSRLFYSASPVRVSASVWNATWLECTKTMMSRVFRNPLHISGVLEWTLSVRSSN